MCGNFDEMVAEGKIVACEAVLFGSEDESDAAGFSLEDGCKRRERDDGLLGLAVGEGSGAEDEGAVGDGFLERLGCARGCEQLFGADGGFGFAPMRFVRSDDYETRETEVGHGARRCSYIEGIAWRDEDDFELVALG